MLAAVDALHDRDDLDDAEWERLVAAVGEEGAIAVLLLTGWYHAISYATRVLRLPLEPGTVGFPGRRITGATTSATAVPTASAHTLSS